jgi:hypothetical protein
MGSRRAACGSARVEHERQSHAADPNHDTARGLTAVLGRGRVDQLR